MASKKDVVKKEPTSVCERPSGSTESGTSSSSFSSSSFETESNSSSETEEKMRISLYEERAEYRRGVEWKAEHVASLREQPTYSEKVQLCKDLPYLPFLLMQTVQRILVEDNGRVDLLNDDVFEVSLEHMNTSTIRTLQLFVQNPRGYYAARELVAMDKRISDIEKQLGQKCPREDQEVHEKSDSLSISLCRQHFNMSLSNAARTLQVGKRLILRVIRAHGYCEWPWRGNKKREERNSSKNESSSETDNINGGEDKRLKEFDEKEISDIIQGVYNGVPEFELPKELKVALRKRRTDVEVLFKKVEKQVRNFSAKRFDIVRREQKRRWRKYARRLSEMQKKRMKGAFSHQLSYVKSSGMSLYLNRAIRWILPRRCHAEIMCVICDEFLPIPSDEYKYFKATDEFRVLFSETDEVHRIGQRLNYEMKASVARTQKGTRTDKAKQRTRADALHWLIGIDIKKKSVVCSRCSKENSNSEDI